MYCKHKQRSAELFKSVLKASLAASVFVSVAQAQPVVYDMGVDDESSYQAFKAAIAKTAYVSTDYSLAANPRVVASITATMVFVSNNPLATEQEIIGFLGTYSNALEGFDSGDPDLHHSSGFFAAVRGMDRGSALFAADGFDTRVSHRMLEALDIEVPAPLDFVSTQKRMVEFENARVRSFTNSPDWSLVLTLALYGQDLDGNTNLFISGVVENYLMSEGFEPVLDGNNDTHFQGTTAALSSMPANFNLYESLQNAVDPNNIDGSAFQNRIQSAFVDMRGNASGLMNDIAGSMNNNPPTVIDALDNAQNTNYLNQQIAIYEADLLADANARSMVSWNSMMLLQNSHDEAQQYSTSARDFSHVRLETDDTLAKVKLGIEIVGNVADALKEGSIGSATSAILSSLDLADAFGAFGSPPSPEEQIFDQIVEVRQDIDNMRVQMHDRFDRVEESLNLIYISMSNNFGVIGDQIGDLQTSVDDLARNIAENHAALERIEVALYGMSSDLLWADFGALVDLVLNYRNESGQDLDYGSDQTNYFAAASAIKSFNVTNSANTSYAGPTTSLLTSFDQAQGVLGGSSIGRNVNDLRTFPSTLGLPNLLGSRVVASAPWTQSASVYSQLANESAWYFAYMYDNQSTTKGVADLDSIIDKGDDLLTMMANGRSPQLFNALLDGYAQTINAINVREAQIITQNGVSGVNTFGGLNQPLAPAASPHFGSLENSVFGASSDNLEMLPSGNQNWNIFNGYVASPEGPNIASASALLIANAASVYNVIPTMHYEWFIEPIADGSYFLVFDFIIDGNGGVPSRGLRAQTRRLVIMDIYETNGLDHLDYFSTREAEEYLSQDLVLWRRFRAYLLNGVSLAGQSIQMDNGNGNDTTFVISSDYYRSMPDDGREVSLGLLEDLQVETWQAAENDNTIINESDHLGDWATLLEAYATLSMPDMLAESTVAASALRGKAFGPITQGSSTIIDYRDSFSLAVDMREFYELNAIDPANYLLAEDRLRPNLQALSDTIDLWIDKPFPGHGYINYMISELNDLRDFARVLAIDDRYDAGDKIVVSAEYGLLANDVDQQYRQIEIASYFYSDPGDGSTLVVNLDGSFEFTPGPGCAPTTSFTYISRAQITDINGVPQYFESDPATVVLVVNPSIISFIEVPGDCPTIGEAIASINDDPNSVIELAPGIYSEHLNTLGKAFTLRSASGDPTDTIISGSGNGRVITMNSGEDNDTVLEGITIRDGSGDNGAGMRLTNASPTIRNCMFVNNRATIFRGGAVHLDSPLGGSAIGSSPQFVNCLFTENFSSAGGGVMNNSSVGAHRPVLMNCTITQNTRIIGGLLGSAVKIAGSGSGSGSVFYEFRNCIFWDNTNGGIWSSVGGHAVVSSSVLQDGVPGNIINEGNNTTSNPFFVDPSSNDFRVGAGSSAIDAGDNTQSELAGILTDLGGDARFFDDPDTADTGIGAAPIVDMGAYEYQGTPPCLADFTGDGVLDFFDVSLFLQAFSAGCPGTSANAQLFQMDYTIAYDRYDIDFSSGGTTDLTVTGSILWDSQAPSTGGNNVNVHYWDYLSHEAVAVGTLDNGTDVGFTINTGPTNGSSQNRIHTTHIPSQSLSWMRWSARLENLAPAWDFGGSFYIRNYDGIGMPLFESPLPSTPAGYGSGFEGDLELYDQDFNSYQFIPNSVSVVITEFDCIADINGDGIVDFFDISGFIQAFAAGCP